MRGLFGLLGLLLTLAVVGLVAKTQLAQLHPSQGTSRPVASAQPPAADGQGAAPQPVAPATAHNLPAQVQQDVQNLMQTRTVNDAEK